MLTTLTDQLSTMSSGAASRVAGIGVVIVLLVLLGNQTLSFYRAFSFQPAVESVTAVTPAATDADYNAATITQLNLFGNTPGGTDNLQQLNLPTTSLQVILRGVFTSSNPQEASAIIQRPDGETRSYKVNASIFDNTRLQAVFNDRIVLSTDGQLETLYFPDPAERQNETEIPSVAVTDIPPVVRELVQNNMTTEEIQQAAKQLQNPALTPEQRKQLIRQRLLELRDRARELNQ